MSKDEILKGNKIIAEFMDVEITLCKDLKEWLWVSKHEGLKTLQYHTSFDWLKPAIDKFLLISISVFNYNAQGMGELRMVKASLGNMPIHKTITDFWNELVTAVTWYNKAIKNVECQTKC